MMKQARKLATTGLFFFNCYYAGCKERGVNANRKTGDRKPKSVDRRTERGGAVT
ncbi:MAG: hypothetical protein RIG62_01385 [Cyclobacteriaceae bacterium]